MSTDRGLPGGGDAVHTEAEDHGWTENVNDHAQRQDSPGYVRSRAAMVAIIKTIQPWVLGDPPYQDHHAGSIPLHDGTGWLFVLDIVGSEWSAQFCLAYDRVDAWRLRVARIVAALPQTLPALEAIGYPDAASLLTTPIMDAVGIGRWVDGIFNASLPVPPGFHTGVLKAGSQQAGLHHYPKPVVDVQFLKRDDFVLWVTDTEGQPAAVLPIAPRGSGEGTVTVAYATPGTMLDQALVNVHKTGQQLTLPAEHPLARAAFVRQETP